MTRQFCDLTGRRRLVAVTELDRLRGVEVREKRYATALDDITAMSDLPAGGLAEPLVREGIVSGWRAAVDEARSIAAHAFREPTAAEIQEKGDEH